VGCLSTGRKQVFNLQLPVRLIFDGSEDIGEQKAIFIPWRLGVSAQKRHRLEMNWMIFPIWLSLTPLTSVGTRITPTFHFSQLRMA